MNLAQLIDPASVWRTGQKPSSPQVAERARGARPDAPREAGGTRPALRQALSDTSATGAKLDLAGIRALCAAKLTSLELSTNIGSLYRSGDVDREGEPGSFRYWLTEQGRKRLAPSAEPAR